MISTAKALYSDFGCAVVDEEDTADRFRIRTDVKQGCYTLSLLFLLVVDWVMRKALQKSNTGIRWKITAKA